MALPFLSGRPGLRLVGRPSSEPAALPELWGGIECTVNRVGDVWFDQIARSGHADRLDDLDRIAGLGIRTLRYPLLWERVAPNGLDRADWGWSDERFARLRELGIKPIVGLVHHGSGPAGTDLLDPDFPDKLAAFARAAAERYPWVERWTPVNEPLTTARFAALYGHWYPHATSDRSFIRALVHQCKAVKLAMAAIRQVNPDALLVQTEDLGKTWSTPPLAYQAEFENERRWLSLDLLSGKVGRDHPLWGHLWWLGLKGEDLFHFIEDPCPPDVIGFNYYLTTERFLDHRLEHYPPELQGGNGRDAYVDVEAVRVRREGIGGVGLLLREAWDRYRRPLAITEAHLGCTREDQIRWLAEVWREARAVRADGIDLRAVTVWSLLGAYDWHCLLTRCEDFYEPGVFDLRAPAPRPTALAHLATQIAGGGEPNHPLLADPGWWQRPERLLFPAWPPVPNSDDRTSAVDAATPILTAVAPPSAAGASDGDRGALAAIVRLGARPTRFDAGRWPNEGEREAQPLLIVGANGRLGQTLVEDCAGRGIRVRPVAADAVGERASIAALFEDHAPWAVIDARLRRGSIADGSNGWPVRHTVERAGILAEACAERSVPLVVVSSGLVFDGAKGVPYVESDPVAPVDPQGKVHGAVEAIVAEHHPAALVVRAGHLLPKAGVDVSPLGEHVGGRATGLATLADQTQRSSFAALPDLSASLLDLLIDGERGVWHLAHPEPASWGEIIRACTAGESDSSLVLSPEHVLAAPASWPILSSGGGVLGSERGWVMPPLSTAIARWTQHVPSAG